MIICIILVLGFVTLSLYLNTESDLIFNNVPEEKTYDALETYKTKYQGYYSVSDEAMRYFDLAYNFEILKVTSGKVTVAVKHYEDSGGHGSGINEGKENVLTFQVRIDGLKDLDTSEQQEAILDTLVYLIRPVNNDFTKEIAKNTLKGQTNTNKDTNFSNYQLTLEHNDLIFDYCLPQNYPAQIG